MTTDAGRHVLKRLCDQAGIDLGNDHDYLMPHGARRGAGEVLVRTSGHAAAARALDNSEEVVREHYSHIEAGDLVEQMTTAFEKRTKRSGLAAIRSESCSLLPLYRSLVEVRQTGPLIHYR